eukprot:4334826-Amphidinium_carterae.2
MSAVAADCSIRYWKGEAHLRCCRHADALKRYCGCIPSPTCNKTQCLLLGSFDESEYSPTCRN